MYVARAQGGHVCDGHCFCAPALMVCRSGGEGRRWRKVMMRGTVYRVFLRLQDVRFEPDVNVPGGNPTLCGFWTTRPEAALAILEHRDLACIEAGAPGTCASLAVAPAWALEIVPVPDGAKEGHDPVYDDGEVFVSWVKHPEEVRVLGFSEALCLLRQEVERARGEVRR